MLPPGGAVADFFRSLGRSATSKSLLMLRPLGCCSSSFDTLTVELTEEVGVVGDSSAIPYLEFGNSPASDKEEDEESDIMNDSSMK